MNRNEIIGVVDDIYEEYEISELGFNLIDFCKKADIVLVPYSSFDDKMQTLVDVDEDGFNIINPSSNSCEIYYNDLIEPSQRIKFTLPHEIGHIMLGHNQTFASETEEQKKEADLFANEFYCPQILIIYYNLLTVSKLISTFGITSSYAVVLLEKIKQGMCYEYSRNEKRLLEIFIKNNNGKK